MGLPVYEFTIGEDEVDGVKTISLVSAPAMKSDFLVFDAQHPKPQYVFLKKDEKEYKGIVAGLAMIPDKLIYRIDEETGEEYNGYFSAETIEKIRNKYHKEVQNLKSVNLEHNSKDTVDAYLVESYLLDTQVRVEEALGKGISEAVLGSWYTAFKIEDKQVFGEVLQGEFKGFSVEAFLNRELRAIELSKQNNFKNKTKKMKKNLVERLKERVLSVLSEVNFEDMLVPELNIVATWGEIGEAVTKTYTNAEGVEAVEPIGAGEFIVEDGRTLVVDENSALVEIREAVVEPAPEEPVIEPAVEPVPEEEMAVEPVVEPAPVVSDFNKPLSELIDMSKDGSYTLEIVVEAGAIKSSEIKSKAQLMAETASQETITKLNEEIEALKVKLSEPIAEPVLNDNKKVVGEAREITLYEKIATRKGLPIV
jgi:hypothetical protein